MHTLLNWLWQGIVVAAAATIVLEIVRLRSAEWKYRFWWAAMTLVLALPALAATRWTPLPVPAPAPTAIDAVHVPDVHVSDIPLVVMAVIAAWVSWMLVQVTRTFLALLALRRIRRRCTAFPAEREARLVHWMTLRRPAQPRLAVSSDVRSAAVIGLVAPVVAVSPQLLDGLTDEQLDRVLVHEWSHIRRRDHIVHAAQLLIRVIAGCHPAVWWIGRRLEAERESACDEMTVRLTGSAKAYAGCLVRLAEICSVPSPALPVPAAVSCGVRSRIVRVLTISGQDPERRLRTKVATAAAGVVLVAFQAGSSALVLPAVEAASLVQGLPDVVSRPPSIVRTAENIPPPARRPDRPREVRRVAPESSAIVADSAAAEPVRIAQDRPEPAPPRIEALPLNATLALDSIPQLALAAAPAAPPPGSKPATPWSAAKDAGIAIGRGSEKAAVSTAGFFNRFGKKIAGSF
jgi:beta-lactamase regulating signal transducer with metallopeptidase domain